MHQNYVGREAGSGDRGGRVEHLLGASTFVVEPAREGMNARIAFGGLIAVDLCAAEGARRLASDRGDPDALDRGQRQDQLPELRGEIIVDEKEFRRRIARAHCGNSRPPAVS